MTLQQQIRANRFRSTIVILGFVLLLVLLAGLIGLVLDLSLAIVALGIAGIYGVFGVVELAAPDLGDHAGPARRS